MYRSSSYSCATSASLWRAPTSWYVKQESVYLLSTTALSHVFGVCFPLGQVGRSGSVCPFVPKALELSSMYLTIVRTAELFGNPIGTTRPRRERHGWLTMAAVVLCR